MEPREWLPRLSRQRYSSGSGSRLSGPLLQSYHGSPRARDAYARSARARSGHALVVALQVVLAVVVVLGVWQGARYVRGSGGRSAPPLDGAFTARPWPEGRGAATGDDLSMKLARGRKDFRDYRARRRSDSGDDSSLEFSSQQPAAAQQPLAPAQRMPVQPSQPQQPQQPNSTATRLPPQATTQHQQAQRQQQQQQQQQAQKQQQQQQPNVPVPAAAGPGARGAGSSAAATASASPAAAASGAAAAAAAARSGNMTGGGAAAAAAAAAAGDDDEPDDPLHDRQSQSEKEAEQLALLNKVVQQQQDTISRQAAALVDLQKRFSQQEHELQAATVAAASSNGSEGVQVEPYFPQERVAQELGMLHKVEAQIEEIASRVATASAELPKLAREQQAQRVAELARADALMGRLSRVAAAISLRTSDPLTEGGHDPVAQLRHYFGAVANDATPSWQEALSRQARPTAALLGLTTDPFTDAMADLDTLDLRLEYVGALMQGMHAAAPCRLALVTTWSGDLWGLRRELLPWLTYHAYLGVSRLFVLYEGSDNNTLRELKALSPWVTPMLASAPLASAADTAAYEAWVSSVPDAHIREWHSQPGNYHLMTKQGYAVTTALQLARASNVSWLLHLDPDELLHPGGAHTAGSLGGVYSLLPELCSAPANVPSIRFVNVEGVPEAADITNRYEQVTLFRAHRHLVPPQAQPFRYIFKQGHADAWLHLYTNGKSAVRPDAPGVTQGGPHVFLGPADPRWASPDNPRGLWRPAISNSTLVLHYAYATPGDVAVKAGRSCPPGVVEQVLAGNASAAAQCFVLDLDQRAFLAAVRDRHAAGLPPVPATPHEPTRAAQQPGASQQQQPAAGQAGGNSSRPSPIIVDPATYFGSSTSSGFSNTSWPVGREVLNFFWGELALSEGAPFECLTPDGQNTAWCAMRDVDQLKSMLISSGLMLRLHAPAQTVKGIETAIQQLLLLGRRGAAPNGTAQAPPPGGQRAASPAAAAAAVPLPAGGAASAGGSQPTAAEPIRPARVLLSGNVMPSPSARHVPAAAMVPASTARQAQAGGAAPLDASDVAKLAQLDAQVHGAPTGTEAQAHVRDKMLV